MRILAIDYGTVRIGLAHTDEEQKIVLPFGKMDAGINQHDSAKKLFMLLQEKLPFEKIVIGLPLQLDGKEGPICKEVRAFGKAVKKVFNTPVFFYNEQYTSHDASKMLLDEMGLKGKKRKELLDQSAAVLILKDFLSQN